MLLAVITLASVGKIVTFLVMLSILIVLHEYGHFIVARRNGVRVNEFAVGMGPKIVGWTSPRSGTLYSLRALPIGGYCAMEGEDGKSSQAEQQREFRENADASSVSFQAKRPLQRLAIVVAGPIANFILAFALLVIGAVAFGVPSDNMYASTVLAGSPASKIGLQPGDRIVSVAIGGAVITDGDRVITAIHRALGKRVALTFERDGVSRTMQVAPEACPTDPKMGCIGFVSQKRFERVGLGQALAISGQEYVGIVDSTVGSIVLLATHFTKYAGQVSGVIGMGQVAGVVQDYGWGPYFGLAATISFALGLFNLLPLPALDGGRGAFILAELLRGKPVDPEKEAFVHIAGFAALMALMVVIAFHDIARIVSGQGAF